MLDPTATERRFAALQERLQTVASLDSPVERTVVALPSLNFGDELLARHDMPSYEQRWLYLLFMLRRPWMRVVFVSSDAVPEQEVEYLLELGGAPGDARERLTMISVDDLSLRALAVKLLDRPDLLERIRGLAATDGSFIVPFNVREAERDVALALDVPIYGIDHRFARYGTKSGGRRLFEEEGVPCPAGAQPVSGVGDLVPAIRRLRAAHPALEAVVVKLDDSVFGEGNVIVSLRDLPPAGTTREAVALDLRLRSLAPAYLADLRAGGGVVEELVGDGEVRSPSVQVRILPDGEPVVLSSHDQVLGGAQGHAFVGARFPADRAYGRAIVSEAGKVGRRLTREGVVGRFGVDFVVGTGETEQDARPYAVEINLREGGTSHPFGALWLLTDGHFDPATTRYRTARGEERHYFCTDALGDPAYRGVDWRELVAEAAGRGLAYDPADEAGVVLFMLRALAREGRVGLVAIAATPDEAQEFYLGVVALLDELRGRTDRR